MNMDVIGPQGTPKTGHTLSKIGKKEEPQAALPLDRSTLGSAPAVSGEEKLAKVAQKKGFLSTFKDGVKESLESGSVVQKLGDYDYIISAPLYGLLGAAIGTGAGATAGAGVGATIGGPLGAIIGSVAGGILGGGIGLAIGIKKGMKKGS